MKNIRITFRLSPYQLARGLQTVRQLEPAYKLISINDLVKTIYHDYLAKMTLNKLDEVPSSILAEIESFTNKPAREQINLDTLLALTDQEPVPMQTSHKPKASTFNDPNNTESDISAVSDFSPPRS